jgi:hypothetical protein
MYCAKPVVKSTGDQQSIKPENRSDSQQIVLVEPAAGSASGHPAEKLLLWCEGVSNLGFAPIVVCWQPPRACLPSNVKIEIIHRAPKLAFRFIPRKQQAKYAEFWTYRRGFQLALRANCPVLGLTASSPIPIAVAAGFNRPAAAWGQIVMYGGLVDTPTGVQIRPRARSSFQQLLKRDCHLLCNAPLTAEMLQGITRETSNHVHHLPDPIDVRTASRRAGTEKANGVRVLVPGQDDDRRTPLWHLSQLHPPVAVDDVIVHHPGRKVPMLEDGTEWRKPTAVRNLRVVDEYLSGEPLISLFAQAAVTVMAYSPQFLQGSANLALAIVTGTPVICSRFPYANYLAARYGRIGEFFTYGDADDFNAAFQRLTQWGSQQREEFQFARRRLTEEVDHRSIVREALATIGALNPSVSTPAATG